MQGTGGSASASALLRLLEGTPDEKRSALSSPALRPLLLSALRLTLPGPGAPDSFAHVLA